MTVREVVRARSVLVPLLVAVVLSVVLAVAVASERRAPSPDANIGLGLLLLAGLPTVALLLLWVVVRGVVLARRGRARPPGRESVDA